MTEEDKEDKERFAQQWAKIFLRAKLEAVPDKGGWVVTDTGIPKTIGDVTIRPPPTPSQDWSVERSSNGYFETFASYKAAAAKFDAIVARHFKPAWSVRHDPDERAQALAEAERHLAEIDAMPDAKPVLTFSIADTNAHTEPQDASKRPFDQVADGQSVDITNEIPVTGEMIAAGNDVREMIALMGAFAPDVEVIYRAMAALAPKPLPHATYAQIERIVGLEAENALLNIWKRGAVEQLTAKDARILHLEAERAAWKHLYEALRFGDPTAPDLPDPPRRPDGTLAPQPKPLPVLKTQEPARRVGG